MLWGIDTCNGIVPVRDVARAILDDPKKNGSVHVADWQKDIKEGDIVALCDIFKSSNRTLATAEGYVGGGALKDTWTLTTGRVTAGYDDGAISLKDGEHYACLALCTLPDAALPGNLTPERLLSRLMHMREVVLMTEQPCAAWRPKCV